MDLLRVAQDIRKDLEKKREDLKLTFTEENHMYEMLDKYGNLRNDFTSVTKFIKVFHEKFEDQKISLAMAKGDRNLQKEILAEWKEKGRRSINLGSRVHYELEKKLVELYGDFKEVRKPIFECTDQELVKSDKMINAGNKYIDLMHERGAVLLDTEMIIGDNEDELVGQADKVWVMSKGKEIGFVVTDWKTNQRKNFMEHSYTKKMHKPYHFFPDTSLIHYYIQLSVYGRLIKKMLSESKYKDIKFFGSVVVLLEDNEIFEEFRTPKIVDDITFKLNFKTYL